VKAGYSRPGRGAALLAVGPGSGPRPAVDAGSMLH